MKPRKILYVPGMFSAIIIPLVFWYLGNRKLKEPIPNVMDLGIPAKYNPNLPIEEQRATIEPIRNWNYKKIEVKPNTAKQNSALYVAEVKKMQQRNKKNTGVEFILSDNNSYGDFASILNDMHIAKQEMYGVDLEKTGHIFAIVDYKDPRKKEEECLLCNDVLILDQHEGTFGLNTNLQYFFYGFERDLASMPKNTFYIIFGFLIFLNVSVLGMARKFSF